MFIFLNTFGLICILSGVYINRRYVNSKDTSIIDNDNLSIILKRLEALEDIVFYEENESILEIDSGINDINEMEFSKSLEEYQNKVDNIEDYDNKENDTLKMDIPLSSSSMEKYKLICKLEKDNYNLEQICKEIKMSKGEVLLLKSLYKGL